MTSRRKDEKTRASLGPARVARLWPELGEDCDMQDVLEELAYASGMGGPPETLAFYRSG